MRKRNSQSGFTLIEILVSASILVIVVLTATSMYVTALSAQRRAYGKQNALDSSRYALEIMGRAIRQSKIITISPTSLTIEHPTKCSTPPCTVTYSRNSGGKLQEQSAGSTNPITAANVFVESITFSGVEYELQDTDGLHAKVTISLVVRSELTKDTEESRVRLQTTITSRYPE